MRAPPSNRNSSAVMSSAQKQPEPEVVELDGAGVVGAEYLHAFSSGWTGGVRDVGVEGRGGALMVCTPSRSSNLPRRCGR